MEFSIGGSRDPTKEITNMKGLFGVSCAIALKMLLPQLQARTLCKAEPSKKPEIVAHIPLNSVPTVQMLLRMNDRGRIYLYTLHPAGEAVSMVDVTDATRPALMPEPANADQTSYRKVQIIGTNTALVDISAQPTTDSNPLPARTIGLLDISDPSEPHVTLHFAGVTAVCRDSVRSLLFIANGDGLWIVRHYEPPDPGVAAWESFVSAN